MRGLNEISRPDLEGSDVQVGSVHVAGARASMRSRVRGNSAIVGGGLAMAILGVFSQNRMFYICSIRPKSQSARETAWNFRSSWPCPSASLPFPLAWTPA